MATDDETRRVAERLSMSDKRDAAVFDCLLAEVVRGREFCETPCEHCHARLLDELADLIEPSERACYYYDAETNHCRCYDTRLVDRDELLALAGDMQDDADICPHEDCRDHIAAYARRIREALGVES